MPDKEFNKVGEILERAGERIDRIALEQQKTDEQLKKIDKGIDRVNDSIDKLKQTVQLVSNGPGRLTEWMALECVQKAFNPITIVITSSTGNIW